MGTYTPNYNLYIPEVGETGWGSLVNQNFVSIDQNLPIITNDGSKWFVNNATYNKNTETWIQIDTTKSSSAIHLKNDGYGEALTCSAGNASITWSELSLDMKNVYTSTGTVNINGDVSISGHIKNGFPAIISESASSSPSLDNIVHIHMPYNSTYGNFHVANIALIGKFYINHTFEWKLSSPYYTFEKDTNSYIEPYNNLILYGIDLSTNSFTVNSLRVGNSINTIYDLNMFVMFMGGNRTGRAICSSSYERVIY